jgi:hypothetical protein
MKKLIVVRLAVGHKKQMTGGSQMMIKRLCSVLILAFLFAVSYGCATNVVVHQKVPSKYENRSNIKHCYDAYKPNVIVSDKLKNLLEQKFKSKITEINGKTTNKTIYFSIEIDKVDIANKGATLLAGAFVGNNSLHGTVVVYDFETNNVTGKYRVEADKNYGGYSAFFDLEDKISEEFTMQVLQIVK